MWRLIVDKADVIQYVSPPSVCDVISGLINNWVQTMTFLFPPWLSSSSVSVLWVRRENRMYSTVCFPPTPLRSRCTTLVRSRSSKVSVWSSGWAYERCMNPHSARYRTVAALSELLRIIFVCVCVCVDVLGGYNGTIFAYGQTSSGKTHTMEVQSYFR